MAKESQDEEYLDNLLNSIVNDKENSSDFDKWFEDELENIDEFEFEENDIDIDTKGNDTDANDIAANDTDVNDIVANDTDANDIVANDTYDVINVPEITEDNNEIDISEVVSQDEAEDMDDLMKMLNDYTGNETEDSKTEDKDIKNEKDNETKVSDEEEDNEIDKLLKELSVDSNVESDNNSEKPIEKNIKSSETIENVITDKESDKKKNKKKSAKKIKKESNKKKDIFKRIFSKNKKPESDLNEINAEEILGETGSAIEDMENFSVSNYGSDNNKSDLFKDLYNLEGKDEEKESKKKEKKSKKEKESKPKKERIKREKIKKEKVYSKDDFIRISHPAIILMISIIALMVFGIYFGSSLFSYTNNINKATNYYVDKDYTEAYNILVGMDVKNDDKDFYMQVENIMKVEKHVNDFNSYIKIEKYAYALEALMNGILSFDENLESARELGTYDILQNQLEEIDALLKNYYGISVDDARVILQLNNKSEYSKAINEKAANVNIATKEGTK